MMKGRYTAAYGVILLAACFRPGEVAFAQLTTADILGTVSDVTGAAVPGATVTARNVATGDVRAVQSSASGDFVFNLLLSGQYTVTVEKDTFSKYVATVTLVAGDRARVDVQLQVGAITQSVEVTARTPALQTDSSVIRDSVSERSVQDLPLNGRNFITLVANTVGAMGGPPGNVLGGQRPDERRQTASVVANGQNEIFNNQLVDGMDNNEREVGSILFRPSIDAISEVEVSILNYTAEVGRSSGAVVNLVTKSGTNAFHGGLYEFLRNDKLNANDFFSNSAGTPRPEYRHSQFGGSLGGPLQKNKTFFFGDIEALRVIQGSATGLLSTVTAFELSHPGNFSDVGGPIIAASQIDPVALKYLALMPAANVPCATPGTTACATNNYSGDITKESYSTTADVRIDHRFGDKDSMFARFSYNPTNAVIPSLFPKANGVYPGNGSYPGTSDETAQAYMMDYVHIFSPTLLMEMKGGFTRLNDVTLPQNYGTNISQKFGLPGADVNDLISGLMSVAISGYQSNGSLAIPGSGNTLGDSSYIPILDVNNVFQYDHSLIWTHGAHNIKIGGGVVRRQLNYFQNTNGTGTFTWSASTAGAPPNSLANFLLGVPTTITRQVNFYKQYFRVWEPRGYVQDDWHPNRWLTLNLGIRWDHFSPLTSAVNQRSNFQLDTNTFCVGATACVEPYWPVFEPRIGFAANLQHGFVVRGGFGTSRFPTDFSSTPVNLLNPPFVSVNFTCQPGIVGGIACPAGIGQLQNGPPAPVIPNLSAPVGSLISHSNHAAPGEVLQYNLTLQKEIGANVFTASYVGELGRHLGPYWWNANMPVPSGGSFRPSFLRASTLPGVQNINLVDNTGASEYSAMQLVFERRYKKGLTVNVNYALAHNLTNISDSSITAVGTVVNNRGYDWGNADIAVKHRIAARATYEFPFGASATGLKKTVIAGWQLNTMAFWQTGLPFNVVDGQNLINLPNTTSDRPNIVAGQSIVAADPTPQHYLNYNAFQQQAIGNPGTEERNMAYGPRLMSADVSVFKDFVIREGCRLTFRAEFYNITNTENFGQPVLNIAKWTAAGPVGIPTNGGSFGQITSSNIGANPRQVQLALKLTF